MLLFRSPSALLTIKCDWEYLRAEIEPRGQKETEALDDDIFRRALDRETSEPGPRTWTNAETFVGFLRDRLPEFERAALTADPSLRHRIAKLRADREQRWRSGVESVPGRLGPFTARGRAAEGAVVGGGLAALALVVGLARCVVAKVAGAEVEGPGSSDLLLLFYVGGFIAAGAVVGLASPMRRSRLGAFALGLVGAGIVFTAIALAEYGAPSQWDDAARFATAACTVTFGSVLAFQLYERRPP